MTFFGKPIAPTTHTCPNCGYCPHCGRSNVTPWRPYPYQPYPYSPYWHYYGPKEWSGGGSVQPCFGTTYSIDT